MAAKLLHPVSAASTGNCFAEFALRIAQDYLAEARKNDILSGKV